MNRTLLIVALALVILAGGYGIASAVSPPHQDYRLNGTPGYKEGSCTGSACHSYSKVRFMESDLAGVNTNDFTSFCLGCHGAGGEAHEKQIGTPSSNSYVNHTGLVPGGSGTSHSWNGSIGDAGTRVPLAGGFSGTWYMPGGKVRCQTCHDGMTTKSSVEQDINWIEATSGDNINYTLLGYASTKQYLAQYVKVYRSATTQTYDTTGQGTGGISESRGKKAFLVNYTAFTYNYQNATVTFTTTQGNIKVYVDITEPYLRLSNQANAICVDCHNDRLSRAVSHEPGTGAKDGHPVMVPFGNRSGLHNTLKASASSNIFIEGSTVECTSCHDPHNSASADGMILRNADKSTLCTNCHKVNGFDGYTTEALLAMHNGTKHTAPTACADCHTTHNTNNIMLIKNKINGVAINFQNFSGPNNFVNTSGTGLCQVSHSSTDHYRSDGTLQDHNVGRNCVECHGHNKGFAGGGCTSCHGFPPAPGNAGPSGWSDTTGNLHSSHMTHLSDPYYGYNLTGTAACQACHPGKPGTLHPENLDTASVDLTAWGGTFSDGGTIGKVSTDDDTCSNVTCHGGGTRTWLSSTGSGGCNGCHNYPNSASDWAADNGHSIRSDTELAHMAATGYNAATDSYAAMTADTSRCGRCHPNNPNHTQGTIALNATGYSFCGSGNFTINQTTTRTDVTCNNALCHFGRTTPNWW